MSVEEKLALGGAESRAEGNVFSACTMGIGTFPSSSVGARGCGGFPKALTYKVFPEMAK
jgi:hypothetical protein